MKRVFQIEVLAAAEDLQFVAWGWTSRVFPQCIGVSLLSALVSRDFFDDFVIQRELGLRDEEVVVHYDRDTDLVIFTSWVRGKEQTYSVPRKDAIRYKSAGRLWSDAP